jgi:general secretion pathway protein I
LPSPRSANRRRANRADRGFGLLEALVALVILASAGVAIFEWINVNLDTVRRVRDREAEDRLREHLAAWAQTLDPARQREGSAEIVPGLQARWTSRPLAPMAPVAPLPGGTRTPFRVGLYEVTLKAPGPAGEVTWTGQRIGIERDADPPVTGAPRAPR